VRITIDIDESLIIDAMKHTGLSSKKAVVEEALRTLIRMKAQESIRSLRCQLRWHGDLGTMREGRFLGDINSAGVESDANDLPPPNQESE
jgi:Arc/MetJ family transcription regulator